MDWLDWLIMGVIVEHLCYKLNLIAHATGAY